MKKKILISAFVMVVCVLSCARIKTQAGYADNTSGWGWGGSQNGTMYTGLGWINTNCATLVDTADADLLPDAPLQICNGGINDLKSCNGSGAVICTGGICENACTVMTARGIDTTATDYGLNIPAGNTNLSGYVWSENVGWISFNAADVAGCPSGGVCDARRSGTELLGWARIMGIKSEYSAVPSNSGGWQGWISLNRKNCDTDSNGTDNLCGTGALSIPAYGVTLPASGSLLSGCNPSGTGCAWHAENSLSGVPQGLGWIDFSRTTGTLAPPTVTLSASAIILAEGESLPKNATLTWTVTGTATSCVASGGWSGPKSVTSSSDPAVSMPANGTIYTLTCCNGLSCADPVSVAGSAGCYSRICPPTGTDCPVTPSLLLQDSNTLADDCRVGCTSNADCGGSVEVYWREVAP